MNIDFHSKNILIVDDVKTNILVLKSLLEDEGYTSLYTATSAKEAYTVLGETSIDLILLDVNMPEISGIEATKHIREMSKYKSVPIIMVTADESDEALQKSFNAGADDYINKPVNIMNLNIRAQNLFISAHKDTIIMNQNRLIAVNDTVQMLAHQWRQPLAAISSSLIDISTKNEMETLTSTYLSETILRVSKSLQTLSTSIDNFAKLSEVESETSLLSIDKTLSDSINIIRDKLVSYNIEIRSEFNASDHINHLPNELIKILMNIYTNSIEAFEVNTVEKDKLIQVSSSQDENFTHIKITDNAGGIDKEIMDHIFDPYFSTKDEKNGVGLGLYNALNVIRDNMGGKLSINSQDSTTIVHIELPN